MRLVSDLEQAEAAVASLLARVPGVPRALQLAGLAAAGVGGLLGRRICVRLAGRAQPVPHPVEPGWHDLMPVAGLAGSRLVRQSAGDVRLVVIRDGDQVRVLADRCSHRSGPLSEGTLDDGCLRCPWHGSVFRVADGTVAHGPATAPQAAFQTRISDGIIQVWLPGAG